ncbi:hypothetical protein HDU82_007625 [Entophlyctis luteolus]|nr:hypothetical protein HDU82_007625 [Entophlyctis luteolus]
MAVLVFLALFVAFAIPAIINNLIANTGFFGAISVSLIQVNFFGPESANTGDSVGFLNLTLNASLSGLSIPANIPVNVSPMSIDIAVQGPSTNGNAGQSFFPLAKIQLPSAISVNNGQASIFEDGLMIQFQNATNFDSVAAAVTNANTFPVGAFLVKQIFAAVSSANTSVAPKISVQAGFDLTLWGFFHVNGISIQKDLDVGAILTSAGNIYPHRKLHQKVTLKTNLGLAAPMNSSVLGLVTVSDFKLSNLSANVTINTSPQNPLTILSPGLAVTSRVNVSNIPILFAKLPHVQPTQGTPNITVEVEATKVSIGFVSILEIFLQDGLTLGIDQVKPTFANGTSLPAWVQDFVGQVSLKVPFSLLAAGLENSLKNLLGL